MSALRYANTTAAVLFNHYDRTYKDRCQQLLSDVDKLFVSSLCHHCVGYGTISTYDIIDHLYVTYENIPPSNLQENETRFRASYDANHPIETPIDQVETSVEYASAVNTPYSPA